MTAVVATAVVVTAVRNDLISKTIDNIETTIILRMILVSYTSKTNISFSDLLDKYLADPLAFPVAPLQTPWSLIPSLTD